LQEAVAMAEPVHIEIRRRDSVWAVTRDGREVHAYGHADEATHAAVRLAHDLIHTGEPAEVHVEAAHGRMIAVDLSEPARVARPGGDNVSAIVPDRGPSG
jgi:hypothetical protein